MSVPPRANWYWLTSASDGRAKAFRMRSMHSAFGSRGKRLAIATMAKTSAFFAPLQGGDATFSSRVPPLRRMKFTLLVSLCAATAMTICQAVLRIQRVTDLHRGRMFRPSSGRSGA
jgi:hypothetical protein